MLHHRLLFAGAVVLTTSSALAQEQPWLSNRQYGEGIGIRVGQLELHPGVAGEFGYDSNWFQRAGGDEEPITSALRLRITPSLRLKTLSEQRAAGDGEGAAPPKLNFETGIALAYNELFKVAGLETDDLSDWRNLGVAADLTLDLLPERPFGWRFQFDYERVVEASNNPSDVFGWNRHTLAGETGFVWRPGGGLFRWYTGYSILASFFDADANSDLNNLVHSVFTKGAWKFLPKTAIQYDASVGRIQYLNNDATRQSLQDGTPMRARVGINGLFTSHLNVMLMMGWGASLYDQGTITVGNFDSLLAHGEVKWFIAAAPKQASDVATVGLSSIAVGYIRDFQNNYLTSYYQMDKGYLKFSWFAAGRFIADLDLSYAYNSLPTSYWNDGSFRFAPYDEHRVTAQVFGEYRFNNTMAVNLTLAVDGNIDSALMPYSQTDTSRLDDMDYLRLRAFLGFRWFM